jgi:hypothetical protein
VLDIGDEEAAVPCFFGLDSGGGATDGGGFGFVVNPEVDAAGRVARKAVPVGSFGVDVGDEAVGWVGVGVKVELTEEVRRVEGVFENVATAWAAGGWRFVSNC